MEEMAAKEDDRIEDVEVGQVVIQVYIYLHTTSWPMGRHHLYDMIFIVLI